jgi:LPXTG-motif cell wall-anchored protein
MSDINGNVVSTQPLVYAPGTTVDLLYPGTVVNSDGSIADVPGWILTSDGFWIRDPSDEFLRQGINLTYTVNPTATAFVTYPPESSTCANPNGPFPPGVTPPPPEGLPRTGIDSGTYLAIAALALGSGLALFSVGRKKRRA